MRRLGAFHFAPANHALSLEQSPPGRHHCELLLLPPVHVEHHPIVRTAEFMGACGIGKEGGVVAIAAGRVQHGEPGLPARVESARRDEGKLAARGLGAVLAINRKQFLYRRVPGVCDWR